MEDANRAGI